MTGTFSASCCAAKGVSFWKSAAACVGWGEGWGGEGRERGSGRGSGRGSDRGRFGGGELQAN